MSIYQGDLFKRKRTGGKTHPHRSKRAFEVGRHASETAIGQPEVLTVRGRGGGRRLRLAKARYANVSNGSGKVTRAEVTSLIDNPANPSYRRRGVITRGAIVETGLGRARVTSTPGSDGVLNAILIQPRRAER